MPDATTYGMSNGSGTSRNGRGEHAPNRDGEPSNCTEAAERLVPAARAGTRSRSQCSDVCRGGFSENHLGRASRHLAQFSRGSSLLRGVGRLGFEPRLGESKSPVLPLHHRPVCAFARKNEGGKVAGARCGANAIYGCGARRLSVMRLMRASSCGLHVITSGSSLKALWITRRW